MGSSETRVSELSGRTSPDDTWHVKFQQASDYYMDGCLQTCSHCAPPYPAGLTHQGCPALLVSGCPPQIVPVSLGVCADAIALRPLPAPVQ